MTNNLSGKFSSTRGKCPLVIPTFFKNRRKMCKIYSDFFFKNRRKLCNRRKILTEITSEGGKTTWNKICWVDILLGESSLGSI